MFKNASKAQRTAAFEYMKFLTEPKQQLYWAKTTGYMPVNNQVLKSDSLQEPCRDKGSANLVKFN